MDPYVFPWRMQHILPALLLAITGTCLTGQETQDFLTIGKTIHIRSEILDETRPIYVRLPGNYTEGRGAYPVLYLFDAELNFPPVCGVVHLLERLEGFPGLIVAGIPNTDRMRDLTPTWDRDFHIGGGGDTRPLSYPGQ